MSVLNIPPSPEGSQTAWRSHTFVHSFNMLLGTYYVPGSRNIQWNKMWTLTLSLTEVKRKETAGHLGEGVDGCSCQCQTCRCRPLEYIIS